MTELEQHPIDCACEDCNPPEGWEETLKVSDDYNRQYLPFSVPVTKVGLRDANTGLPLKAKEDARA